MNSSVDAPEDNKDQHINLTLRRLVLDERKAEEEFQLRSKELDLKAAESNRARWSSPLVLSIFAATIAAAGNAYVSWLNGANQLAIESTRNSSQKEIEQEKAEASRILEAIKAANPKDAAEKIRFLIDVGLIANPNRQAALEAYLAPQKTSSNGNPPSSEIPIIEHYASGWLGGGNNQADQCIIGRSFMIQKYLGKSILLKSSSEQSKKDIWGHVEYRYFCDFEIK